MQFEDADEDAPAAAAPLAAGQAPVVDFTTPRAGAAFVDDESMPEEEEEDDEETWDEDADDFDEEFGLEEGLHAVMDQDWADAAGDFTKRYNRMKQQVLVSHGAGAAAGAGGKGDGASSSAAGNASARAGAVLPASNRRRAPIAAAQKPGEKEAVHLNKVTDQLAHYSKFAARISLDPLWQAPTSGTATRKGGSEKLLVKDKSDRATNEQVLDPRTRLILFKMLGRGLIERIDGCVSTGKEANVYHAVDPEGKHIALKIYKTSILVFKDRDRYVTGEFRFKGGYARSNPRKMVRLWAEKEMRNLRRMRSAGLRVPEAIEVRENVLAMDFLGENGEEEWQASPRLKDAQIPPEQNRSLYVEILVILRAIFFRCRLVHADFSEYNILYHQGHLWVIDVSQSIEHEHPAAFDFLRTDLKNADDFFAKRGVDTLGLTRTFAFVTRDSWITGRAETDADAAEEIERLLSLAADDAEKEEAEQRAAQERGEDEMARPGASDEAVFAQAYIPRTLDDVYDVERDVERVLRGEGDGLIYADITGVASIHKKGEEGEDAGKAPVGEGEAGSDGDSDEGSEDGDSDGEDSDDEEGKVRRPRGKKHEDKDEKKKRKQETKEKAREKRSTKMKKSEKARRVKKSTGKR
ncbi:Serine/threonine-protein kinase rio1 [Rhodotorula kratochvilovae]